MASRRISKAEMLKRVARFNELTSSASAFVDTLIPGHEREIYNVIGRGVTEDPALAPAITAAEDFHMTLVKAAPGKGAALHFHRTVEVFMPLSGEWAIYWGDEGAEEIVLGRWDVISVPPGVMRGFRNAGAQEHCLLAILGGADPGRVTWASKVLERARQTGLALDESGNLVRLAR